LSDVEEVPRHGAHYTRSHQPRPKSQLAE
jgi:hypothetical protein